jgi:hypothetical protein
MYTHALDPVSIRWGPRRSSRFSPCCRFLLMGGVRMRAQPASLISLAVAVAGGGDRRYGMPFGQALDAGAEGASFGFLSIMWIVINARTPALLRRTARPTVRAVPGRPPVEEKPFGGDERAWGVECLAS